MKYIAILLLYTTTSVSAQVPDQFFKAVGNNDYVTMASLLSSDVELCINDVTDILTREEAITSIKKFLARNTPTSINPMHGGESAKNNSKYKLAKLQTNNGTYRVFVYQEGDKKIQEVRFDKF